MIGDRYPARKLTRDSQIGGNDDSYFQAFRRACLAFRDNACQLTPEDRVALRDMAEKLLPRSKSVEKRGEVSTVPSNNDALK